MIKRFHACRMFCGNTWKHSSTWGLNPSLVALPSIKDWLNLIDQYACKSGRFDSVVDNFHRQWNTQIHHLDSKQSKFLKRLENVFFLLTIYLEENTFGFPWHFESVLSGWWKKNGQPGTFQNRLTIELYSLYNRLVTIR